jgi:uncharacterized peroxidase-related enzyme
VKHHGEGLRRLTKNDSLVEQLKTDFRKAVITEHDRLMLEYAWKLTLEPWAMVEADVGNLRQAGFSDRDILDMNMVAGYFAFANRLADGLGVELEPFWESMPER